ncbi:MAG: PAS domain S-box protein [Chitinophagaceae bacterium]|nr:PAS domain S-box protein [Chitinophagaceae bacterium]
MSAKTNTENNINSLLPFCYEQLINRSNISDALQSITKCIVENTDAVFSCVFLNKANEKRTYQYINKNNTTLNKSIITQITDEIVNVNIEPNILYTEANFSAIKNIIHATEINTILIFPISKNELKEFIIIAFKHKINTEQYHTLLQKLAVAISNSSTTENIRNELYLRSDVYESTLATLNQLIWDFDFRTNVIHVLGFAPRIGNFIPQQTITTDFKDWLQKDTHPDDLVRTINHFQNSINLPDKSTTEIIFRVLEATKKEYIWVHVKHTLLCDDEGKPAIMVGSISDIHDSKQVAFELEKHKEKNEELIQMLRENNEKFITILNSSKDIIFTIDLQTGQIENVNKAIKKLGYSPKEWVGQYYTQWTLEKRKKFHDMLKHASESNTSVRSRQVSFATKDNKKLIPFEFSTSVFYFKEKKYLLCILRDITERLEHENSIKKVTEQLTHLINNINDVYAIYNLKEKKYEFVSDNIENLLGCSKADFIAHGLYWEDLVYTDDYVSAKNQMNEIIKNK